MEILVKKAKKHDKEAFQRLMEQHGPSLYKTAKAILKNDDDVADAMQETALTCWEKIDTLKSEKYFKTWLMRILINHCNAIYRLRLKTVSEEIAPEVWSQDENYSNVEWEDFLNGLDEKYRIVIVLYYVEGFKTKEIAEILQISESTVRGRMVTAREKLEAQYARDCHIGKALHHSSEKLCIVGQRGE